MAETPPLRIIQKQDLEALLPMGKCIEIVDECMRQVSLGNAELPLRWGMPAGEPGAMGMMPGYLGEPACFGIKLVSLFPDNPAHGFSSHSGLMVLFEPQFGQPIAVMDAGYLTAMRTAAASAVATRTLARRHASTVAILGTGEQARFHAPAMAAVRPIDRIVTWGRTPAKAEALSEELRTRLHIEVETADTVAKAVSEADIICTVTAAKDIILHGADLPDGCHVNAVGASIPPTREIDLEAVKRSRYYVDYRASAFAQATELIEAIEGGELTKFHVLGEIGEVLLDQCPGRESDSDITLYRSLGVAAQDLAAAHHIYTQATKLDLGCTAQI